MKLSKIHSYTIGLQLTSLVGYLEWGGENQAYLYEMELEILGKLVTDPLSVLHPFVLIPFLGQLLLLWSLFSRKHKPKLVYAGIGCIGLLMGMILFIGILNENASMIASAIPFLLASTLTILEVKKWKTKKANIG